MYEVMVNCIYDGFSSVAVFDREEDAQELIECFGKALEAYQEHLKAYQEYEENYDKNYPPPVYTKVTEHKKKLSYPSMPTSLQGLSREEKLKHPDYAIYQMAINFVDSQRNSSVKETERERRAVYQREKDSWEEEKRALISNKRYSFDVGKFFPEKFAELSANFPRFTNYKFDDFKIKKCEFKITFYSSEDSYD